LFEAFSIELKLDILINASELVFIAANEKYSTLLFCQLDATLVPFETNIYPAVPEVGIKSPLIPAGTVIMPVDMLIVGFLVPLLILEITP
jgi:hypothetical protein